jgi:hypothetical protein
VREHTGGNTEWSLYWTARGRPVPCQLVPALAGWAGIDERERAAGIEPGHPILIDPEFRLDPVLAGFLARSRFAWLAEGTRKAYARDYRPFFSFLWQRGKYWHEVGPDDLLDWECWRRRGQEPGRRISGSQVAAGTGGAAAGLRVGGKETAHCPQPSAGARGPAARWRHGHGQRRGKSLRELSRTSPTRQAGQ